MGHVPRRGAQPYLVQGCESVFIAQVRADLILQEVAYCNRGERSEHPVPHQVRRYSGGPGKTHSPQALTQIVLFVYTFWGIMNGN